MAAKKDHKKGADAPRGLAVSTLSRYSFFDVPVYRVSQGQYDAQFKQFEEKQWKGMDPNVVAEHKVYLEQNRHEAIGRRDRLHRSFGGPWHFNEIVGYVRLHFVGNQVRGELWMVDKKRVRRTRTKQFSFQTYKVVPELDIPLQATNRQVYETIKNYVDLARVELRPRFLDTSVFERVGRFVDWNGMRKESPLGIDV